MNVAIFIDTNQYLDLFRMIAGKVLLEAIEEQRGYIFVSTQIADEVMRRTLDCAVTYFADQMKDATNIDVPDHLLGIGDEEIAQYRSIFNKARDAKVQIKKRVATALLRISRSEDDVSKRLDVVFGAAVEPGPEAMKRARERREKGNPPGKDRNALGDQIAWELFLEHCKNTGVKRVWIVSKDSDYLIKAYGEVLINPFLHRELMKACGEGMDVRYFNSAMTALTDFVNSTGVTADRLPTGEKAKEIEKEEQSLPPFVSSSSNFDDAAVQIAARQRALRAAIISGSGYSGPPFPPSASLEP